MRLLLPDQALEPIAGDLDEEWSAAHPPRARYWRLALVSIAAYWLNEVTPPVRAWPMPPAAGPTP